MAQEVTLPALGESVTEGTVTRWLKKVGDTVAVDEPLVEISTDKVDTEIPSPIAGVVEAILVAEDETVEVGAVLARIGDGSGVGIETQAGRQIGGGKGGDAAALYRAVVEPILPDGGDGGSGAGKSRGAVGISMKGHIVIASGIDGKGSEVWWNHGLIETVAAPGDQTAILAHSEAVVAPCRDGDDVSEAAGHRALTEGVPAPSDHCSIAFESETVIPTSSDGDYISEV
jgi:pyruvate/2-oxoglutarate dehydrogenase complex dihydrolipoamide acyltransferase (E2) component